VLERIKGILNKIPFTIVVLAIVAWIITDYYKFNNAPDSPLAVRVGELKRTQDLRDANKKKLEDAKAFFQNLEKKREEIRALFSKLSEMRNTLTEDVSKPALIELVTTEAKRAGLKVSTVIPEAMKKSEYYSEHPFKLKFKGVYVQLMLFLKRISDTKRILRVDQFALKPTGNKKFGPSVIELDGEILISTYTYNGSKADDLVKQTPAPTTTTPKPGGGP